MTKAEILTLVQDLTQSQADSVTISSYFDQVLDDLGRILAPPLIEAEIIPLVAETNEYSFPDNAICEQAIIFNGRELRLTSTQQLSAYSASWQDHKGSPWAYTKDDSTARTFRLYPAPHATSGTEDGSPSFPLGPFIPSNSLLIFYSSRKSSNIPTWLVFPIVYQILAWEFARPSKHQSEAFASLCQELSDLFFSLLGIMRNQPGEKK